MPDYRSKMAGVAAIIIAFALSTGAFAAFFPTQAVQLGFTLDDRGSTTLSGLTFGASQVTLDSSKLHFFVRPYGFHGTTRDRAIGVTIGRATKKPGPNNVQQFLMPLNFLKPPAPGVYDVFARAVDGFATTPDGSEMPLRVPPEEADSTIARVTTISWPDESRNDRELVRIRSKLVGHLVYGYGGISIACRPDWEKRYSASTPVRIRSVERQSGRLAWRYTGRDASAPYALGLGFLTFDPLLIVVDAPTQTPVGENYGLGVSRHACPAFELADWQVDTSLSLDAPPASVDATLPASADFSPPPIRAGMSRDDVIWTRGYPNEIGTRAALRAQSTWQYGHTSMDHFTVTFADNHVVSLTTPGQ